MRQPAPLATAAATAPEAKTYVWVDLLLVLAFACALRSHLAPVPLERDEGEYAYIAQRWFEGGVPYQDSFDQKPPGVFVAYAVILKLFGTTPTAIHWGAQVYTLGTLAVVFGLGRKLFGQAAGFAAAMLVAILITDKGVLGSASNTETFMALPLVAGLWTTLMAVERDSWRWGLATGLCAGLALLFKQQAVLSFLFCFGYLVWFGRRRLLLAGVAIAGCLIVMAPTLLYFWAMGAFNAFFDCVVGYNLKYSQQVPLAKYPEYFWRHFSVILKVAWPAYLLAALASIIGLARWQRGEQREHSTRMLVGWLVFSFAAVTVSGIFRQHYFIQIIPAIGLLAGRAVEEFARFFGTQKRRWAAYALPIGAVALGSLGAPGYYFFDSPNEIARELYKTNPFAESLDIASFVARHSQPQDTIFVFGSEPQIYYYAHRRCASRYIFVYPLFTPFADTRARQDQVLAELRNQPPKFIVFLNPFIVPGTFLASKRAPIATFYKDFTDMLHESYDVVGTVLNEEKPCNPLYVSEHDLKRLEPLPFQYRLLNLWEKKS